MCVQILLGVSGDADYHHHWNIVGQHVSHFSYKEFFPRVAIRKRSQQYVIRAVNWKIIIHTNWIPHIDSVLFLFNSYPADPALQAYLTYALNNGLLSLPTLVATFFEAAKSFNFRDSTTIDAICHLIQDEYYKNGLVPTGLLLRDSDATPETLEIIKNSLSFLRIAQRLAIEFPSPFRDSVSSSSELVALLLSSVTDLSQIPISQAMSQYADVMDLLQSFRFSLHLQRVLEQFALHLSMILGDDSKMAQEAQMIQTMQATQQYSLSSEVYFKNPNAHTDLITGSLLLRQLVRWVY